MKKYIIRILILLLLFGCASPKRLIKKGEYDHAIKVLVKKLISKPDNQKYIQQLDHAYRVANQINLDSIAYLRQTGQPDIWYSIYNNYLYLKNREDLVKTVPAPVLKKIGFKYIDYNTELINAKKKAAAYLYAHAKKLMDEGGKSNARKAYSDLWKITTMYDDYKDTDALMRKALVLGTDYILFRVINHTAKIIPQSMLANIQNINLLELDQKFVDFNTRPVAGRNYDYNINLILNDIGVTPEQVKEKKYTESRKIVEGYKDKVGSNGEIVKDSSGKVVKVPVYKTIECKITVIEKHKSAKITGMVDFVNNNTGQIMNSTPVSAESVFHNVSAYAKGDLKACSEQTLKLLDQPKLQFPSDSDMMYDASNKLKETIKQVIWRDESLMK